MRATLASFALLSLALVQAACLVETKQVADPEPAFAKARAEAARAQAQGGRPGRVLLLAYDPADGELLRVSAPMWLWKRVAQDLDLGDGPPASVREALRPDALERAGRGLLIEVNDGDGSQLLVWLR